MSNYERKGICIGTSLLTILSGIVIFLDSFVLLILYGIRGDESILKANADLGLTAAGVDRAMTPFFILLFAAIAIFCIGLVLSVMKCGAKEEEGGVTMTWYDRLFVEVHGCIGILAACLTMPAGTLVLNGMIHSRWIMGLLGIGLTSYADLAGVKEYGYGVDPLYMSIPMEIALAVMFLAIMGVVEILSVQAIAKKLKNHRFWKDTIVGRLAILMTKSQKTCRNLMLVLVLGVLISCTWLGAIAVLILIFFFVPKYFAQYDAVKQGITEVSKGNLEYKVELEGEGEFQRLAEKVNSIADAQQIAVNNQLKNERMKTELITNVSHDLRTPITSMITYVDLLKHEGLESPNASEYLEVIQEKTEQLHKLTEDLFEAAKASSGDIPVRLEPLDLQALTEQALGEFTDSLEEKNLDVVFRPGEEPAMIQGDGRLLYRIMENILTNVTKYAQPRSRVYVDLLQEGQNVQQGRDGQEGQNVQNGHQGQENQEGGQQREQSRAQETEPKYWVLTVKNISASALNIDAEELMSRFTRGDASRNTEGSGLGLAIARDLARVMGGQFQVHIDGDLFKCTLKMPRI